MSKKLRYNANGEKLIGETGELLSDEESLAMSRGMLEFLDYFIDCARQGKPVLLSDGTQIP